MSSAQPQPEARFAGVAATNSAGIELGESWWVKEVRRRMEADAEELGAVAKVFDVPRLLRATKPEAYTPQHFALGPYHHQRTKLRDMERCKLAAAKRVQKEFAPNRFDDLVTKFDSIKDMIRAPYHRFLEVNDQTLTWMMAIDTCFLLDFLQDYYDQTATDKVSSSTNWINATVRDAMVRDTMMLENQIPMSLFFQTIQLRPISNEDETRTVLEHFITEVSPIKTTSGCTPALIGNIVKHGHLLELLYHFLVPDYGNDVGENHIVVDPISLQPHEEEQKGLDSGTLKWVCMHVSNSLHFPPILFIKRLISKIMQKVPLLSAAAQLLGTFMASTDEAVQCGDVKQATIIKSPLAEEIMIPSVAQLAACGVRFTPSPKGLYAINFDPGTATLTLPILHLDSNTDVILRNLVAYETAAVRGPLVLARYTELMNGIIDTPKDVKILVDCHIITNRMKSNKEAADMWNGMCRAVRPTMVPHLDRVIREVNEHRNQNKAVKARRLLRRYVFRSWRLLTLVAAIVLLLMMSLQTFCTFYDCRRWLGHGIPQLPQLMPEGGQ